MVGALHLFRPGPLLQLSPQHPPGRGGLRPPDLGDRALGFPRQALARTKALLNSAFGAPLLDNQYLHFRLAELQTEIEALRALPARQREAFTLRVLEELDVTTKWVLLITDQQRLLREARRRDTVLDGRTVLLAEDDVRNIFALSSVFEPLGAKLIIARNGKEALHKLETEGAQIDLVLMDIMMPEMDGFELLSKLRGEGLDAPVLFLTARDAISDRVRGLETGADDYVVKPYSVVELMARLRTQLRRTRPAADRTVCSTDRARARGRSVFRLSRRSSRAKMRA